MADGQICTKMQIRRRQVNDSFLVLPLSFRAGRPLEAELGGGILFRVSGELAVPEGSGRWEIKGRFSRANQKRFLCTRLLASHLFFCLLSSSTGNRGLSQELRGRRTGL